MRLKTAISIPDDVYRQAEEAAARLGLSRSALYARAVAEYIARRGQAAVTKRLDRVYRDEPARLDPLLAVLQLASLPAGDW